MANTYVPLEASDSRPLLLEELSDHELKIIIEIERRLYLAQQSAQGNRKQSEGNSAKKKRYLVPLQERPARVLLLDGSRGTGKTSILLTLVHRWSPDSLPDFPRHDEDAEVYQERIDSLRKDSNFEAKPQDIKIPKHVQVVGRVLDFDPLPPEMPLVAGIIQAWQPLADHIDERSGRNTDCDEEGETLMDLWHSLFRVAAVGFAPLPQHRGLIDQVLDRQEQVQDWQRLEERWQEFVDEVIKTGKCIKGLEWYGIEPVFVIMIDDCDLQVGRIRQLLPALRMLYHPNVYFLVAADRRHMAEMLQLDFYGQQSELAHHQNAKPDSLRELVDADRWAVELADSSVNKVFPLKNRWKLRRLTLHELLEFPKHQPTQLKKILDEWPQDSKAEPVWGSLGTYLMRMAGIAPEDAAVEAPSMETVPIQDSAELPPIMSYRTAHQIFETASTQKEPKERALEAIRHLLGRGDPDDRVRISERRKKGVDKGELDQNVEYLASGKLAARFHEGFREETGEDSGIVLSARPDFAYSTRSDYTLLSIAGSARREDEITSAVIAASLRDDGYGVIATDLAWDISLALAWTEDRVFVDNMSLAMAFQWPVHVHPSPLRLLMWSREWREFIQGLQENPDYRRERIAYAWIYYQLSWLRSVRNSKPPEELPHPLEAQFAENSGGNLWQTLLDQKPETGSEQEFWPRRMQRLAIPELGVPVKVQSFLLKDVREVDVEWLREQRRRYITDAIVAAADQANGKTQGAEDEGRVSRIIEEFERRHRTNNENPTGSPSPWWEKVEKPWLARQGKNEDPQ